MKIVFLCGSLEQGRDGVGDYTRRLAGELIRQKHEVGAVAINDKFIDDNIVENEVLNGALFPICRISNNLSQKSRFAIAQKWIESFKPIWISLQFVPFSFHQKGLPLGFGSAIKKLTYGTKLHIMFHELWVGANGKEKFKMRVLGVLQRRLINNFIATANPARVTTSIKIYQKKIPKIQVDILPLFGNIPIVSEAVECSKSSGKLKVVHFGSFTGSIGDFKIQLEFLKKAAQFQNKEIDFIVFGDGGPFKVKAIGLAKELFGAQNVIEKGRLSTLEVSLLLQSADVGISRADFVMAGKSGSTLAMLEHGLPVLLRGVKPDFQDKGTFPGNNQLCFVGADFSKIFQKLPPKSTLSETAEKFVCLLSTFEKTQF